MTTPATTPNPPPLNGLVIGQAERVTRAVLDRLLATEGRTFHEWVVLNLLHGTGGDEDEQALVALATARLRISDAPVRAAVAAVVENGQLDRHDGRLALTAAGAATRARIQAGIDGIAERFYGDLPAADLATAGRILAIVTSRAEAELAAV